MPSLLRRRKSDRSVDNATRTFGPEENGDSYSARWTDSSAGPTLSSPSSKSTSLDESTPTALLRTPKDKKKKSIRSKLKSFKGFITGKSRKERREARTKSIMDGISEEHSPSDPVASPTGSKNVGAASELKKGKEEDSNDMDESVYGMEWDDNMSTTSSTSELSTVTSTTKVTSAPVKPAIEIILFLLDKDTRRFEILQVDIDSPFAIVNDILQQIPLCATEPYLQRQTYGVVCDRKGRVMQPDRFLVDYFPSLQATPNGDRIQYNNKKGSHAFVVLAMTCSSTFETPITIRASDCVKLARPILQNPKILQMLLAMGIPMQDTIVEETILEEENDSLPQATCCVESTVSSEPMIPLSTESTSLSNHQSLEEKTKRSGEPTVPVISSRNDPKSTQSWQIHVLLVLLAILVPILLYLYLYLPPLVR